MENDNTKAPHHLSKEGKALRDAKKPLSEREFDPNKSYTFKMTNKTEGTSFIPRSQKVWCELTKKLREIRYCRTEDSPYVDEQNEDAKEEKIPLTMVQGELILDGSNSAAIKYLLASDHLLGKSKVLPQNNVVRGRYYLVDDEARLQAQFDKEENELEAKVLIKKSSKEDLENFIRSNFRQSFESEQELRVYAYSQVGLHADKFLVDFNNPLHKIKSKVQTLFAKGLLSDSRGTISWTDTKAVVLTFESKGTDGSVVRADEALAKFVLAGSKEAKDFEKLMEEKTKS